jgi:hypothetical protein
MKTNRLKGTLVPQSSAYAQLVFDLIGGTNNKIQRLNLQPVLFDNKTVRNGLFSK